MKFYLLLTLILISCAPPPTQKEEDTLPTTGFYNNEEGSPAFTMLNEAKRSIDIEIYQMQDRDFIASVRSAVNRGVKVRIIKDATSLGENCRMLDPVGSKDDESCKDQKQLVQDIRNAGGTVVAFNKKELCGGNTDRCFEHGKLIIADKSVAMLSTGNFNTSSFCNAKQNPSKCNRDYSVVLRDTESVAALHSIYEKDLEGKRYDVSAYLPPSVAARITVSPLSLEPLVALIKSAKSSIKIQNQYLKDTTVNDALKQAAKNGIEVQVTLASTCAFGKPSANETKKLAALYLSFDEAGIKTRMFTAQNIVGARAGYMHAKTILIDNERAWVGSVNGSLTALTMNREFGAFFSDDKNISKLKAIMDKDFAYEGGESWQESLECKKDIPDNGGDEDGEGETAK